MAEANTPVSYHLLTLACHHGNHCTACVFCLWWMTGVTEALCGKNVTNKNGRKISCFI